MCYSALHAGILGNNTGSYLTRKVHKYNYTVSFTCDADKDCDVNGSKVERLSVKLGKLFIVHSIRVGTRKLYFNKTMKVS